MTSFKKLEAFVIVALIAVFGIVYAFTRDNSPDPVVVLDQTGSVSQNQDDQLQQVVAPAVVTYPGQDGRTALELLKAAHRVETQSFGGVGEYVKSIDGTEPDSSHFWAFYVNGQMAQVGAGEYQTKSTETIEWKLEEIK